MASSVEYDLIVLDLMLPRIGGLEVVKKLRSQKKTTPVLILTARDERESIVSLLECRRGRLRPRNQFDLGELLARAKAVIRRGKGQSAPVLTVADLQVHTAQRAVRRGAKDISLTPMEYRVLEYLAHRQGTVVSQTELLEHLYDYNWEKFSNVIEVYISGFAEKSTMDSRLD